MYLAVLQTYPIYRLIKILFFIQHIQDLLILGLQPVQLQKHTVGLGEIADILNNKNR